jgi:BirA family biotin operon repressor/biotin-[acetyl-CoA-carboxylase] ligase
MDWNLEVLEKRIAGKLFGHKIHYYSETESTNDEAFSLGIAGAPEGTVFIADSQSGGKGRMQRVWHSPAGSNIYTSVLLRPQIESSQTSQIPITAGVAVAEVLDDYCPGKIKLKWPNDILIDEKKVCGILTQARITAKEIDFVVLGMGINVNIGRNQLPEEIRDSATSLSIETGGEISRMELIISLYENLAKWYKRLLQSGFSQVKEKWLSLTPMIGQTIQVIFRDETIMGKATGLDEDGSLILLTDKNETLLVSAGDATIVKR